jgi:hypothetical protein
MTTETENASMNVSIDDLTIRIELKPQHGRAAYHVSVTKHDAPVFENKGFLKMEGLNPVPNEPLVAPSGHEFQKRIALFVAHIDYYNSLEKYAMKNKCIAELFDYILANADAHQNIVDQMKDAIALTCKETNDFTPYIHELHEVARTTLRQLHVPFEERKETMESMESVESVNATKVTTPTAIDFPPHHC